MNWTWLGSNVWLGFARIIQKLGRKTLSFLLPSLTAGYLDYSIQIVVNSNLNSVEISYSLVDIVGIYDSSANIVKFQKLNFESRISCYWFIKKYIYRKTQLNYYQILYQNELFKWSKLNNPTGSGAQRFQLVERSTKAVQQPQTYQDLGCWTQRIFVMTISDTNLRCQNLI